MTETISNGEISLDQQLDAAQIGQLLGWDSPKFWATHVQVFRNTDHVLIVFRETANVGPPPAEGADQKPQMYVKNVASVVLPINVAKSFGEILNKLMTDEQTENA